MNVDNIKLLDAKLREPETAAHFDLNFWFSTEDQYRSQESALHTCGTVACIAGWAAALALPEARVCDVNIRRTAIDWLGLSVDTADRLFDPGELLGDRGYGGITPTEAADVLDRLIETGEVTW